MIFHLFLCLLFLFTKSSKYDIICLVKREIVGDFMKKNNRYSSYENESMNLSNKEQEIFASYNEDEVEEYSLSEDEEFEVEEVEDTSKEDKKKIREERRQKMKEKREKRRFDREEKKKEKKLKKQEKNTSKDILEEFQIEEDNSEEVYDEYDTIENKKEAISFQTSKKSKRRVVLLILFLFLIVGIVSIDVVRVTKYEKTPIFAIPIRTYKDGGTKEYFGIGYKVIQYKQVQGRRDIVIGTWGLRYDTNPIDTEVLDLAIEFNNDEVSSYHKYNKKFLRIVGNLSNVSEKQNQITLSYVDEDGKYSFDVICNMADKDNFDDLFLDYDTIVIGTMSKYRYKTKTSVPILYLDNCFAAQE